jgi:hypothetical protein
MSNRKEAVADVAGGNWLGLAFLSVPFEWVWFPDWGTEEILDMLTRLLVLASLPLRLLEIGRAVDTAEGVSKGLVLVGGVAWGSGSTGRLVRGALVEGVALKGVAGIGVGRSRR